jgi:acetylornithine deacetylase/succinyl-diaminopimelate desuccinylase-like protein
MSQIILPLSYAQANQGRFLNELKDFIRFPSISAQSDHAKDTIGCAYWLANQLMAAGLENVQVETKSSHPLVYADWLHASSAPTVIVYGHYDVQPIDPLKEWRSPPFEPVERGADLFGRGASDDKGQLLAHVKSDRELSAHN